MPNPPSPALEPEPRRLPPSLSLVPETAADARCALLVGTTIAPALLTQLPTALEAEQVPTIPAAWRRVAQRAYAVVAIEPHVSGDGDGVRFARWLQQRETPPIVILPLVGDETYALLSREGIALRDTTASPLVDVIVSMVFGGGALPPA